MKVNEHSNHKYEDSVMRTNDLMTQKYFVNEVFILNCAALLSRLQPYPPSPPLTAELPPQTHTA